MWYFWLKRVVELFQASAIVAAASERSGPKQQQLVYQSYHGEVYKQQSHP
jgi:predicted transcriptional regulator